MAFGDKRKENAKKHGGSDYVDLLPNQPVNLLLVGEEIAGSTLYGGGMYTAVKPGTGRARYCCHAFNDKRMKCFDFPQTVYDQVCNIANTGVDLARTVICVTRVDNKNVTITKVMELKNDVLEKILKLPRPDLVDKIRWLKASVENGWVTRQDIADAEPDINKVLGIAPAGPSDPIGPMIEATPAPDKAPEPPSDAFGPDEVDDSLAATTTDVDEDDIPF